jgi:hypothetical protein
MEDVLDLYAQPYDPCRPVVCFDEMPKQLLADLQAPLPVRPGTVAREDYEYGRRGVKNLFLWCEPLRGKRHVEVTDRRTMRDWAHCIKDLIDVHYPDAEVIRLVVDNLNTHTPASLYLAFDPAEARRLTSKLEVHYTPKHGSWLNAAEIELAILSTQCLDRRIPDVDTLRSETTAWVEERDAACLTVNWHFTTSDARIKLASIYPTYST